MGSPSGTGLEVRTARVATLVQASFERWEATGELPDLNLVLARHPDLASELSEQFRILSEYVRAQGGIRPNGAGGGPPSVDERFPGLRAALLPAYALHEQIHAGGQGVVYRATQTSTGREVAIKVLMDGRQDGQPASLRRRIRFEREAGLISRLRHTNIVTLYESGVAADRLYYVMEYVAGEPIHDYVLMRDPTVAEIVGLFIKVCRALDVCHRNGVIHRDLHPSNIVVEESGEPRLLDFGLAKDMNETLDERVSAPLMAMGVLRYMSPEHLGAGSGSTDTRSDIYGLGVILFELLTEQLPYALQGEFGEIRRRIVNEPPLPLRQAFAASDAGRRARLSDANADLEAILQCALAKSPDERYATAGAMADDLERFRAHEAVDARKNNRIYVFRKLLRRYRWPAGVALGTVATLIYATGVAWHALRNARSATLVAFEQFERQLRAFDRYDELPGGREAGGPLLRDAQAGLSSLAEFAAADAGLRSIQVRLAEHAGRLALGQGNDGDARREFERFLAGSKELFAAGRDDLGAAQVVRAYRLLGLTEDQPAGQAELARGFVDAERKWVGPATAYELCALEVQTGQHLKNRAESDAAHACLSTAILRYQARPNERAAEWDRLAATAFSVRAQLLAASGQAEDALADLNLCRTIREAQLRANPASSVLRLELAAVLGRLGDCLGGQGCYAEALALLHEAARQGELVYGLEPTLTAADTLLSTYSLLVRIGVEAGQSDATWQERAEALLVELAGRAGDERKFAVRYAEAALNRGLRAMERSRGTARPPDLREVVAEFEQVVSTYNELVASDPTNRRWVHNLAIGHHAVAFASLEMESYAAAIRHYDQAALIFRRLLDEEPAVPTRVLDLVGAQVGVAGAHLRAVADLEASKAALDAAAELLGGLPADLNDAETNNRRDDCWEAVNRNRAALMKLAAQ